MRLVFRVLRIAAFSEANRKSILEVAEISLESRWTGSGFDMVWAETHDMHVCGTGRSLMMAAAVVRCCLRQQ